MKKLQPLDFKYLRKQIDAKELGFKVSTELETLTEFVGQERALESILFGIGIQNHGYNLYAMGPPGIGKRSLIRTVLQLHARKKLPSDDWCYIYNFASPEKPIAIHLPAGDGIILQNDMKECVEEIATSILAMFESDQYRSGIKAINDRFNTKREKASKVNHEDIKIPHLYKERLKEEKNLQSKFTISVVKPLIRQLKNKYHHIKPIVKYLSAVQKDIVTHVNEFVRHDENTNLWIFATDNPNLFKYEINLLVDNSKKKHVPIIFEENPSYSNLIARIEHVLQLGSLVTNFTLIRSGSLHRANGGYLIIEACKLRKEKAAWESLKRSLYSKKIIIDMIENLSDSARTVSLEPMPIPLNIKIILLGNRHTFYTLSNHDPDFSELFKVAVDFDEQVNSSKKNIKLYARLIATIARREALRPFHATAIAAIINHCRRIAEDVEKLSTRISNIDDLILEADYWAGLAHKKTVTAEHVLKALQAQIHRLDRTRELYQEDIQRNFIIINTKDHVIGQINCLSVVKVGKFSYGHPTRLTVKASLGYGKVIDIQREIKLAGPIHTKGALIMANFLQTRYVTTYPFSLHASISFEQIYGAVDGDSASVGELCALISALVNVPIKQYLAVTGSIDQCGNVQAVGGVNEKIEGFFDICKARGLTGREGVLIPAVNQKNLMVREDVVLAAKEKKFHIYLINTIDEAITLLTGLPAGTRTKNGKFTPESVNAKVEEQLEAYSLTRLKTKK